MKKKVVVLIENEYHDLELWYPIIRLREAGIDVILAGPVKGASYSGKYGYPAVADIAFSDLDTSYDCLLIPGGHAPEKLITYDQVLTYVQAMHEKERLIAFICHGALVPLHANILNGKNVTATQSVKEDLENGAANFIDEPLVFDYNLISSRMPKDLHLFGKGIIDAL